MPLGEKRHHAAEVADVAPHVAAVGLEIEDGVGHELAGAVKGDVPSPPALVERDAQPGARRRVGEHVRALGAAPERDDRLVLEEEQRVADLAGGCAPGRVCLAARGLRRTRRVRARTR